MYGVPAPLLQCRSAKKKTLSTYPTFHYLSSLCLPLMANRRVPRNLEKTALDLAA